jgi:hypothetical protein
MRSVSPLQLLAAILLIIFEATAGNLYCPGNAADMNDEGAPGAVLFVNGKSMEQLSSTVHVLCTNTNSDR